LIGGPKKISTGNFGKDGEIMDGITIAMTDPWCWYFFGNIKGVSGDGIHVTIYGIHGSYGIG